MVFYEDGVDKKDNLIAPPSLSYYFTGAKRSPVLLQTGGFPDDQYSFNSSRGLLEVENSNGQAHTPLAPIVLVGNGPVSHIRGVGLHACVYLLSILLPFRAFFSYAT